MQTMEMRMPDIKWVLILILYNDSKLGAISITPTMYIAKVGFPAKFLCHVNYPIDRCRIQVPGFPSFDLSPQNGSFDKGVFYHGEGFDKGDCGVLINTVLEKNNGDVKCELSLESGIKENGSMRLIIAEAPEAPRFHTQEIKSFYKEGDIIDIECIVSNGKPAANLTLFIDDKEITDGLGPLNFSSGDNGLETVSQHFKKFLSIQDNRRKLTCVASHFAFPVQKQRSINFYLNVFFPPKVEQPIKVVGKIGEDAVINVTVHSCPGPDYEWFIDDQLVTLADDRFQPHFKQNWDHPDIFYVALVIQSIKHSDLGRKYELELEYQSEKFRYAVELTTTGDLLLSFVYLTLFIIVILLFIKAMRIRYSKLPAQFTPAH